MGKKEVKLSIFAHDMIIENPVDSTKVLELINEFSKSCKYKIKT